MKWLGFLAIMLPSIALAQTPPAPSAQPSSITPPSATGNPHVCGADWYPPAALAAGEEGTTRLGFKIGVDGATKNIAVLTTSGYADLDQAAVNCAAGWKYHPAAQNGQPIEIDWKADVKWAMDNGNTETVVATRGTTPASKSMMSALTQNPIGDQICQNPSKPPAPLGKTTFVSFVINVDGSVTNVRLFKSSGDNVLDGYALTCVQAWRFTPRNAYFNVVNLTVEPVHW